VTTPIHFLYLEPALMIALSFGAVLAGIHGSVFFSDRTVANSRVVERHPRPPCVQ
jgi:hypothetical protein